MPLVSEMLSKYDYSRHVHYKPLRVIIDPMHAIGVLDTVVPNLGPPQLPQKSQVRVSLWYAYAAYRSRYHRCRESKCQPSLSAKCVFFLPHCSPLAASTCKPAGIAACHQQRPPLPVYPSSAPYPALHGFCSLLIHDRVKTDLGCFANGLCPMDGRYLTRSCSLASPSRPPASVALAQVPRGYLHAIAGKSSVS